MSDEAKVKVKIVSAEGFCAIGHKAGDEFEVGLTTPQGICNTAYIILLPAIRVLQAKGQLPWQRDPGVIEVTCSDPAARLVFQLTRIEEGEPQKC